MCAQGDPVEVSEVVPDSVLFLHVGDAADVHLGGVVPAGRVVLAPLLRLSLLLLRNFFRQLSVGVALGVVWVSGSGGCVGGNRSHAPPRQCYGGLAAALL